VYAAWDAIIRRFYARATTQNYTTPNMVLFLAASAVFNCFSSPRSNGILSVFLLGLSVWPATVNEVLEHMVQVHCTLSHLYVRVPVSNARISAIAAHRQGPDHDPAPTVHPTHVHELSVTSKRNRCQYWRSTSLGSQIWPESRSIMYKRESRYLAAIMHYDHGAITRPLRVHNQGTGLCRVDISTSHSAT
jgi:hypothetical protein